VYFVKFVALFFGEWSELLIEGFEVFPGIGAPRYISPKELAFYLENIIIVAVLQLFILINHAFDLGGRILHQVCTISSVDYKPRSFVEKFFYLEGSGDEIQVLSNWQTDKVLDYDRVLDLVDLTGIDAIPPAKKAVYSAVVQYYFGIDRILVHYLEVSAEPDLVAVA
jgi:hypothetical protein